MATRRTYTYSIPHILRTLSYVVVLLLGLAITLGVVFSWWGSMAAVGGWIKNIALTIGLIVLCWYSYYDARSRNTTWFILWVVAVVLVVLFMILGMVGISIK